jgi:hypothetical protein
MSPGTNSTDDNRRIRPARIDGEYDNIWKAIDQSSPEVAANIAKR